MSDSGQPVASSNDRLFILGLDGVPCSLVRQGIASGDLPRLAELVRRAGIREIRSELPTVSSVAWASFVTGSDPATHGIFGFVDRNRETGELFIPTGRNRRAPAIWKRLSDRSRPAIAVNIPGCYPPEAIRGVVVAGFLCPSLEKATARPDVAERLAAIEYVIDVDATLGRAEDKAPFFETLHRALAKRRELARWLLDNEPWDYFQLHIMETDRINHFAWEANDDPASPWHRSFRDFYRAVDALAGELIERVDGAVRWMILSDHGFCRTRVELNVNALLRDLGYLRYHPREAMDLSPMEPASRAFSLLPGRIYVNLEGRERHGCVAPGDYETVLAELAGVLEGVTHPETGERLIDAVHRTRDIYTGPHLAEACDLLLVPKQGVDLRGGFRAEGSPFGPASIGGIHTYGDAFVIDEGILRGDEATIRDVGRRVAEVLL